MGNDRTGTQCAPLHVVDRDTPVDGGQAGGDTGPYKISASVGADVLIGLSSPNALGVDRAGGHRPPLRVVDRRCGYQRGTARRVIAPYDGLMFSHGLPAIIAQIVGADIVRPPHPTPVGNDRTNAQCAPLHVGIGTLRSTRDGPVGTPVPTFLRKTGRRSVPPGPPAGSVLSAHPRRRFPPRRR